MKTAMIFGTRPEAIKMAPLYKKMKENGMDVKIIATAQHREMLDQVLELFQIKPDYDLNIMKKNQSLPELTSRLLIAIDEILKIEKFDYVLVQGDTTSSFVGSLSAFYNKIPVGHVEAGLRANNIYDPFPEEMNRRLTGTIAQHHFASTQKAKENLLKENVEGKNIIVTGNTVIDALLWVKKNKQKDIEKFLKSITKDLETSNFFYEIIIIDNGSNDNTLKIIKEIQAINDNIVLIELGKNTGTTFSRNIGLKLAKGQYIYILDSDTEIPVGTTVKLMQAFSEIQSNKIGIICPQLVYPNGDFQESARRFPSFRSKLFRLLDLEEKRKKAESYEKVLDKELTVVNYAISAAWFLKKELLEVVGYLDENIFYAPEDAEFCARVWSKGYEVWYYPKAIIIHDCKRVTKKKPLSKLGIEHIKGLIYFWKKHKKFLKSFSEEF